ncbi:unnamed protein product [Protopolystoma xenopodis]|uniref:Uncharacterized protein n=1 Tax=Protopolystoma xenopodis TaxID=117903 RepID=A0A3S5BTW6_9PLAT|nr:unnamed protein product [Protopolystoma xenopodis]
MLKLRNGPENVSETADGAPFLKWELFICIIVRRWVQHHSTGPGHPASLELSHGVHSLLIIVRQFCHKLLTKGYIFTSLRGRWRSLGATQHTHCDLDPLMTGQYGPTSSTSVYTKELPTPRTDALREADVADERCPTLRVHTVAEACVQGRALDKESSAFSC